MQKIVSASLLLFLFGSAVAQTSVKPTLENVKNTPAAPLDCKPAKDSLKNRLQRGEISFYNAIKFKPGQYDYVTLKKNSYSKVTYPKDYPSVTFVYCYNNEIKKVLDSIYKTDFLGKTDSILRSYDKAGHGYRNAEFPGGPAAMQVFINKNISLPKDTKSDNADKQIRVFYSFLVDEKGTISDIKLMRSNCKACEEPVLNAIKQMPAFIPATDAGVAKKIRYILPYTKS